MTATATAAPAVDGLPLWAQRLIRRLRAEAAASRAETASLRRALEREEAADGRTSD